MKGLITGIEYIDKTFSGIKDGKLYCIGCSTSVDRTNFIAKLTMGLTTRENSVLLLSLEKNRKAMFRLLLNIFVHYYEDKEKGIEQSELMEMLGELPVWIEDAPNLSYNLLLDVIQRLTYINRHAIDVILVDNVARMTTDFMVSNINLCLAANLYLLKMIAKEYKIPVITFVEISRNPALNTPFAESEYIDNMVIFQTIEDDSLRAFRDGAKVISISNDDTIEHTLFDLPTIEVELYSQQNMNY